MVLRGSRASAHVRNTTITIAVCLLLGFFIGTNILRKVTDLPKKKCAKNLRNGIDYGFKDEKYFKDFVRPRKLIYIGMMSARQNVETRVRAAFSTWADSTNQVTLEVFAGNDGTLTESGARVEMMDKGIPIIQLPGVHDTAYPPQKKSFAMIKYFHDHHLNDFDWFIRLDDDAYLKLDQLEAFLSKINSSRPLMIGQPGYGRDAEDYVGLGENYCMGGTGVIFSRELLKQVGPKLGMCLQTLFTEHEDIELGRCVLKTTGVKCTEAWDSNIYFFQNYARKNDGGAITNIEHVSKFKRKTALALHANKKSEYQHKLHKEVLEDKIESLILESSRVREEIARMNALLSNNYDVINTNVGMKYKGRGPYPIWNWVTNKIKTKEDNVYGNILPIDCIMDSTERNLEQMAWDSRHHTTVYSKFLPHVISGSVQRVQYNLNPLVGIEALSEIKPRRSRNRYLYRTLQKIDVNGSFMREHVTLQKNIELLRNNDQTTVHIILTLSGRTKQFQKFLQILEKNTVKCTLIVSMYSGAKDFIQINNLIKHYNVKYSWLNIKLVQLSQPIFSKLEEWHEGVKLVPSEKGLTLFCDENTKISNKLLYSIRRNTVEGKSVYSPVAFQQFNPDIARNIQHSTNSEINEIAGFWSTSSYNVVSIYKSDFNKIKILKSDNDNLQLISSILKSDLSIIRSNEQNLIQSYHRDECWSTNQKKECTKSNLSKIASQLYLADEWNGKHQ